MLWPAGNATLTMYFTISRPPGVVMRPLEVERPPAVSRPLTERPLTERPLTDRPLTDRPLTDRPFSEKPFTDKPFADQPLTDRPLVDQPLVDQPLVDQPFTDKPFNDSTAAAWSIPTSPSCSAQPTKPTMAPSESPAVMPNLTIR